MPDVWPDWPIGPSALAELAGYVAVEQPRSLPMGAELRSSWTTRSEAEARARQLYRLLTDRSIRYATEAFAAAGREVPGDGVAYQRIRSPEEVLRGVGSCLDLSLLFANLAIVAGIRPLLAIRLENEPHALVVLDVERPLSDHSAALPDYWRAAGPGVFVPTEDEQWRRLGRRWCALDVVGVTRDARQDFRAARGKALESGPWFLVDVPAALALVTPHEPPEGAVYPIHTQLPEVREFRDYPGRIALRRRLEADMRTERRVVVHGPGGRGKSMLAERLAWGADNGCGWVLKAPDVPTLRASLAAAERAERGLSDETGDRGELIDATEVVQFARAALDRLRSATVPWVVVLDNCDLDPETADLAEWIPDPQAGQVVIVTTRDERWLAPGDESVPALTADDLTLIGLPGDAVDHPLAANPLTAETVARLGAGLPPTTGGDPHDVIWDLVRKELGPQSRSVMLAALLAWVPSEPVDVADAPGATAEENISAAAALVALRFVAPTTGLAAELAPGSPSPGTVAMHREYSAAIRRTALRDGVDGAARTLSGVLSSVWGRSILTRSVDLTALAKLETDAVPRMAERSGDPHTIGLLWQGLGHVRERRGPVAASEPFFVRALDLLDGAMDPYGVAEAHIGIARLINQRRVVARYAEAQERIDIARSLLADVPGHDAAQLAEQGGALYWLIEQHKAGRERDPAVRLARLCEVREELWLSFERRMRLWSGAERIPRTRPPFEAGLGPERAFYNLAGVNLAIAKTRHATGLRAEAAEALVACDSVYRGVAELRALRYGGRPHPHHAACVNGQALVAYHQVTLLEDRSALPDAYQYAVTALRERWAADEMGDVRKSVALLVKIALAGGMTTAEKDQHGEVGKMIVDALAELTDWLS